MNKRKSKLYGKVVIGQLIICLAIVISCGVLIGAYYRQSKINSVSNTAFSYTRAAADFIDGDTIEKYYTTHEKNDYYYVVLNYLDSMQKDSDIQYYYVFVPEENGLTYIWDADTKGNNCELGDFEEYQENGKEAIEAVFCSNPAEKILMMPGSEYGYIAGAFSPVYNSDGEPVAVVGADLLVSNLNEAIFHFIAILALCVLIIGITASIGSVLYMRHSLVQPIWTLSDATNSIINNLKSGESIKIDIHTNDEIDQLARDFEKMQHEIDEYMENLTKMTAEKERIGAELDLARKIQADMLPSIFPPFPEKPEIDIYAVMHPAKEVGGDFYDFFLLDEDHIGMVIGDVSGKGVPAALFMVISKTIIKNEALAGGKLPAEILTKVNSQLCQGNASGVFCTAWLGILNLKTGHVISASAGHEFPALMHTGGDYELLKDPHGLPLAAMEGVRYKNFEFDMEPGSRLFVYTDGVPEATNTNNEFYETKRMLAALNESKSLSVEQQLVKVQESVDDFVKGAPQFDDITKLCVEYKGCVIENRPSVPLCPRPE